ncbi:hypothetical protein B0H11DRAFT_2234227 [Mycena galericulata]|nr:hypothetical protein B0H11DRAFT_2234227 [Mycena galericulata]
MLYVGLAVIVILAATQVGAGVAQTIILSRLHSFFKSENAKVKTSTIIQLAGSLLCDLAITIHLFLTFNSYKNLDRKLANTLDTLIICIVNRGALTAISACVTMALFLRWPDTFWFVLTMAPCSKVYMNSMLATLNVREVIREKTGYSKNLQGGREPEVEGALRSEVAMDPGESDIAHIARTPVNESAHAS